MEKPTTKIAAVWLFAYFCLPSLFALDVDSIERSYGAYVPKCSDRETGFEDKDERESSGGGNFGGSAYASYSCYEGTSWWASVDYESELQITSASIKHSSSMEMDFYGDATPQALTAFKVTLDAPAYFTLSRYSTIKSRNSHWDLTADYASFWNVDSGDSPSQYALVPPGNYRFRSYQTIDNMLDDPQEAEVRFELYLAANVEGRVVNERGEPVSGAYVNVSGGSATTDASGRFLLEDLNIKPDSIVTVSAHKEGHQPFDSLLERSGGERTIDAGDLVIEEIEREIEIDFFYGNEETHVYFLDGVTLPVTARALTTGEPWDVIEWSVNNGPWMEYSGDPIFDVGSEFGIGGTLHARGRSEDGSEKSAPVRANFDVIPLPGGIGVFEDELTGSESRPLVYRGSAGMAAGFLGTQSIGRNSDGEKIPLLTDEAFQFDLGISSEVEVFGTGFARGYTGKISQGGLEKDFKFSSLKVAPKVGYTANWNYDETSQEWLLGGSVSIGIDGKIQSPPAYLWLIPPVYGRIGFEVGAAAGLDLIYDPEYLPLPKFQGTLGIEPSVRGSIGLGLSDIFAAEAYAKGGGKLQGRWDGTDPELETASVTLTLGIEQTYVFYTSDIELASWSWDLLASGKSYPTAAGLILHKFADAKGWEPIPRSFEDSGEGQQTKVSPSASFSSIQGNEVILEYDSFRYSQCRAVSAGESVGIFKIVDGPERSSIDRTVLVFQDVEESGGDPVHDDGTADFAPAVTETGTDEFVVAWQNAAESLADSTPLETFLSKQEISVADFNAVDGASGVTSLTSNSFLDRSPAIASLPDGTVLLAWIENQDNDPTGSSGSPNVIRAALRESGVWSEVERVADNLGAIPWIDVGFHEGQPTVLFSLDSDDDLSTPGDQELYSIQREASWGAAQRETNNQVQDTFPRILHGENGNVSAVVWIRDGALTSCPGFSFSGASTIPFPENSGISEFSWCAAPAGQFRISFPVVSAEATYQVLNIVRDDQGGWTPPLTIVEGSDLRRSTSTAVDTSGTLHVAYNISSVSEDAEGNPVFEDFSCALATLQGKPDLRIVDVRMNPEYPSWGENIELIATVENAGASPSADCEIGAFQRSGLNNRFYTSQSFAALASGASREVRIDWTMQSGEIKDRLVVEVDPGRGLSEITRDNNQGTVSAFRPDLAIKGMEVSNATGEFTTVSITIENLGLSYTPSTTAISVYSEAAGGDVLAETEIGYGLAPDSNTVVRLHWKTEDMPNSTGTNRIVAHIDSTGSLEEILEDNNWGGALIPIRNEDGSNPLTIFSDSNLPTALSHSSYYALLRATGGVPPFSWTIVEGGLPDGFELTEDGAIHGVADISAADASCIIRVSDAGGNETEKEFLLSVRDSMSYDDWLQIHFSAQEIATGETGKADDFDGDEILNEVEFSTGSNPRVDDSANFPSLAFEISGEDGILKFLCNSNAEGVNSLLQASSTLSDSSSWEEIARSENGGLVQSLDSAVSVVDVGTGMRIVTIIDKALANSSQRRFYRLVVLPSVP